MLHIYRKNNNKKANRKEARRDPAESFVTQTINILCLVWIHIIYESMDCDLNPHFHISLQI